MSAKAVRRFVASLTVRRACPCGTAFETTLPNRVRCDGCVARITADAAEQRRERARLSAELAERKAAAKAKRAAMYCDRCKTRLLTPAPLCGFCSHDAGALAAALDTDEPAVSAAGSATPNGRKPR